MSDTFEAFVEQERARLGNLLADVARRRAELDREQAGIEKELEAVDAYVSVKAGRAVLASRGEVKRRVRGTSRRDAILGALGAKPAGLSRSELLDALGIMQGDKAAQSVSNALANMKRAGQVENRDGRWVIG